MFQMINWRINCKVWILQEPGIRRPGLCRSQRARLRNVESGLPITTFTSGSAMRDKVDRSQRWVGQAHANALMHLLQLPCSSSWTSSLVTALFQALSVADIRGSLILAKENEILSAHISIIPVCLRFYFPWADEMNQRQTLVIQVKILRY